jgi:hypothetical protein
MARVCRVQIQGKLCFLSDTIVSIKAKVRFRCLILTTLGMASRFSHRCMHLVKEQSMVIFLSHSRASFTILLALLVLLVS